jgi:BirA family biotin operon repressor/biotin-[acetyl-CoA-carboxylase] ligase
MRIGSKIIYLKQIDSTNNYLKNHFETGLVVYTDKQTNGRGQRLNKWESEAKKNILMSVAVSHHLLKTEQHFFLSKAVSLAVFDFLSEYITKVKIKWPNDIYVSNKKIAGILIENSIRGSYISNSIIGIGINVNQNNFPAYIPNPISLSSLTGQSYAPEYLLKVLIQKLNNRYKQIEMKQFKKLSSAYIEHLYLYKTESLFLIDQKKIKARIINIEDNGRLVLQFADNNTKSFAFKELSFINEAMEE